MVGVGGQSELLPGKIFCGELNEGGLHFGVVIEEFFLVGGVGGGSA